MLIRDVGRMCSGAYKRAGSDGVEGAAVVGRHDANGSWDAFQAVCYSCDNTLVVAFRGTDAAGDVVSDVVLGAGMNSGYFSDAEKFVKDVAGGNALVCGHSLGGAIAQVVANRMKLQMVTFNAPGVAVLASRNIAEANPIAAAVRVGGMLTSAVVRPMQAWRDMKSAFNTVRGINICLENDVVSKIGVHYGRVERIPGTSSNPATEHRMATMNSVLAQHAIGAREAVF